MRNTSRLSNILGADGRPVEIDASHYDVVNRWSDTDSWKYATNRSADSTDLRGDRNKIAAACGFEYANNPYCRAMVDKLAFEIVATGPVPEITPRSPSKRADRAAKKIERLWRDWAEESDFVNRLILNISEPVVRGEIFNVFRSNFSLTTVPIEFEQYEGIQFGTPYAGYRGRGIPREYPQIDGLELDRSGNIVGYHKMKHHPGSNDPSGLMYGDEYDTLDANIVCHIFQKTRPTQYRGIAQLAPVVEQFAYLRRFTEAYIEKAEKEASILATIETRLPIDECIPGPGGTRTLNFGPAQMMNMPEGWGMNEFKGSTNGTQYKEFVDAKLREIMSVLLLPWNIASGDSSDYNFSSSRMDHLIFDRVIAFIRQSREQKLINRFFKYWYEFAKLTPGLAGNALGKFDVRWYWPKRVALDEVRQSQSLKIKREIGLLDEPAYWQNEGMDWKEASEKRIQIEIWEEKRRQELRAEAFGVEDVSAPPIPSEADEPVEQEDTTEDTGPEDSDDNGDEQSPFNQRDELAASRFSFSVN